MRRLNVGVIGVGHLGEYHVQKYKNIPSVNLVGVVDIDRKRAREIGERYNTRIFYHHRDILDLVDAVSLAVPTSEHYKIARDVLSRGIHLLVEKPITYSLEPADILIRIAEEQNLILQVGLVERFNPAVREMEKLLTRPVFLESHRMNRFTRRGIDVDVVLDLMIHDLDIFLHIIPSDIKEIHAVGMSVITDKTDIANARLIFENGTVANLTASRVSNIALRKIRVFQTDSFLSVDCQKRTLTVIKLKKGADHDPEYHDLDQEKREFPESDPLQDEIFSFVESINDGKRPEVTGHDGRRALDVALRIMEQIKSNSKILNNHTHPGT